MICLSLLVGGGSSFTPRKPLNIAIRECMYFKDGEVPVRPIAVVGWLLINDQLLRLCYSIDWSAAKRKKGRGAREREKEKKNFVGNWKARLVRSRIQSWHNCQRCVSRDIVRLRPTVHRKQIRVRQEHAMALFVSFIDGPSSSECQREREKGMESLLESMNTEWWISRLSRRLNHIWITFL